MTEYGFAGKYLKGERPSTYHKVSAWITPAVISAQVRFPDISFYDTINWSVFNPPGVIIRAGQNVWVDTKFKESYAQAKAKGIPRGVYWFYDSRVHPQVQADLLVSLIADDHPEMEIFCDWEKDYGGGYFDLSYAVEFMKRVEAALPSVTVGIYTGYYFFTDNSSQWTHAPEYAYLGTKPLWLAWYTSNPDYVKVPAPWVKLTHWQNSDSGTFPGIENGADTNFFNGTPDEFAARYSTSTPEGPTVKEYIYKIPRDKIVRAFVTGYSSFKTVAQAAADFQATVTPGNKTLGFNGDGWSGSQSNSLWCTNGVWRNFTQASYNPRIAFDASHQGCIAYAYNEGWYPERKLDHNTFSLTRRLVTGGKINPAFRDNGELNSRLGFGFTAAGDLVICAVDGWDYYSPDKGATPPAGWTLTQLANKLIANGVIEGGDGDAGGSMTIAEDGKVINYYNDDGVIVMRPVVNHFFLELVGDVVVPPEPPPIGDGNMEVIAQTRRRLAPNFFANTVYDTAWKDATVGYKFVPVDSSPDTNPVTPADAGVIWYKNEYQPGKFGWIADSYPSKGEVYLKDDTVPPTEPPASVPDLPVSITLGDDITYKKQTVNVILKGV